MNDLKIAICLSGLLRSFEQTHINFVNKLIGDYSDCCDIYMHMWKNGDSEKDIEKAISLYKPVKFKIENARIKSFEQEYKNLKEKYGLNIDPTISWPPSLLVGNYAASACFSQIDKQDYDIIIRARYDTQFIEKVPLSDYLNLNHEFVVIPAAENYDQPFNHKMRKIASVSRLYLLNDQFAFGSHLMMKRYFSLYNKISYYMANSDLPIGIFYHPEALLCFHMNEAFEAFGEIIIDDQIKMKLQRV